MNMDIRLYKQVYITNLHFILNLEFKKLYVFLPLAASSDFYFAADKNKLRL